jgi:hypothetical protein
MKKATQGLIISFVLLWGCTRIITESDLIKARMKWSGFSSAFLPPDDSDPT